MDMDTVRKRLDAEHERLSEDLRNLQSDADEQKQSQELSVVDQHPADIGTETFEMEKTQSIIESLEGQLRDIDEAKGRVENGTYGQCQYCHEQIAEERLEALPGARYCIEHQEQAEGAATTR